MGILLADRLYQQGGFRLAPVLLVGVIGLVAGLACLRCASARIALALLVCAAAGAVSLGSRLDAAGRAAPSEALSATVDGIVCRHQRAGDQVVVELCDLSSSSYEVHDGPEGQSVPVPIPARVRLREPLDAPAGTALDNLRDGQALRVALRLRPVRGLRNPGGRNSLRALARRGVGARASLVDPVLRVRLPLRDRAPLLAPLSGWRRTVGERLVASGPGGALLGALAVGERSRLAVSERDAFRRLGISHVLAVSGLHLALVAGLAYAVFRRAIARATPLAERIDVRTPALLIALVVAFFYALLAGWGVPVRRALVFIAALCLSLLAGRRLPASHAVGGAVLVILAFDPGALFDPGAQLSFAASAALLVSIRTAASPGAAGRIAVLVRTSATAVAATAPVLAYHGGAVTPVGLVANLFIVPWTAGVLLPASALATACVALPGSWPTRALASLAERIGWLTLVVVERVAALTPEGVGGGRPHTGFLIAAGVLALCVLRLRATAARLAVAFLIALGLHCAPPAALSPPPPRLVVLDVGQGDASLIQTREAAVLVDAGLAIAGGIDLGASAVVPALRALGVSRLDLVCASHADADHRGGLPAVVARFPVGQVWLPPGGLQDPAFSALLASARGKGVPVYERGAGDPGTVWGDLVVTPLWPPRDLSGTRNARSLVLRIDVGAARILLPGDMGSEAEHALLRSGADLRADVLKLAHHGSRSSSSPAFLAAVGADVAIVSAACGRRHLPTAEALTRTREAGASLWWTGRDGAVFVSLATPLATWSWAAPWPGCVARAR